MTVTDVNGCSGDYEGAEVRRDGDPGIVTVYASASG